jgi:hypothetical protein
VRGAVRSLRLRASRPAPAQDGAAVSAGVAWLWCLAVTLAGWYLLLLAAYAL